MQDLKWSDSEKKLARRVFEAVLETELAEIMTAFKAQVAATYMDIENARCIAESDYYSKRPLPFPSRAHLTFGNQN